MITESHWAIGTLLWFPFFSLIALAVIAFAVYLTLDWRKEKNDAYAHAGDIGIGAFFVWVFGLVVLIAVVALMFPFSKPYHYYQAHTGTVTQISSRIVGGSDSINQKFVVRFKGDPTPYSCEDTRCALLKVGDDLSITCRRSFQFAGEPGYDCAYVDARPQQ